MFFDPEMSWTSAWLASSSGYILCIFIAAFAPMLPFIRPDVDPAVYVKTYMKPASDLLTCAVAAVVCVSLLIQFCLFEPNRRSISRERGGWLGLVFLYTLFTVARTVLFSSLGVACNTYGASSTGGVNISGLSSAIERYSSYILSLDAFSWERLWGSAVVPALAVAMAGVEQFLTLSLLLCHREVFSLYAAMVLLSAQSQVRWILLSWTALTYVCK